MEKLPMCRICLVQNVRMFIVVNKNLRELYEKLTDIPFVTEDSRPILACFICCTKLKQCYRLLRQCLEAEELFAQKMNEDYELNPLVNQDHFEFYSGFIKSPIVHISIDDECRTESIAIKDEYELSADCEELDDIIEPKEEQQSYELEPENTDNSCLDKAEIPPHDCESDLEDDVPLMEFKTEVEEEHEISKKKQRTRETKSAIVSKNPKLETRRTKLEHGITAEQTRKDKSDSNCIRTAQKRTSKPDNYFKEPLKSVTRSFRVKGHLSNYIRRQTGEESYKCDVCQRNFVRKRHLTRHIRIHIGEKPYKCDLCQCNFTEKAQLTRHVRKHTGEKPHKCNVCQRSFSVKGDLTKHIRIHTGGKPYQCDVCQRNFTEKGYLTIHERKHTGEKPYKCNVCQRSFSVKGNLTQHIRIHTGEKPYTCEVCQHSFRTKHNLRTHIRIHSGEKPYTCPVCQRSFSKKYTLKTHILIHTGEKPYTCEVCQRSFSSKSCIARHNHIHTGAKHFKCDICEVSYRDKRDLIRHIRKHSGEKPFKCKICRKSFSDLNALKVHLRAHT